MASPPNKEDRERATLAVLNWAWQASAERVPARIHDLAARALNEPSLAYGFADDDPDYKGP